MPNLEAIERRLTALERDLATSRRSARRYRILAGALLGTLAGLGGMAATAERSVADVIHARRFEVLDDDGKLLMALSAGTFGGQVDIWNRGEQNLIRLGGSAQGGDVALWNKSGVNVFGAYATRDGGMASIWNNDGRQVFSAASKSDGGGQIDLGNKSGQTVATLNTIPEVGAALAIRNDIGKKMLIVGAHEHGGAINLWNVRDVPIFVAGFGEDLQSGQVTLRNSMGVEVFKAGVNDDGGGLITLLNDEGRKPRTMSASR